MKEKNKEFNRLNKEYGLTEYLLHTYVKLMQHNFKSNIDSFTAQKIATRVYKAFEKYMFHQAKGMYFKKFDELNSLEAKSNKTGIRFKDDKLEWIKSNRYIKRQNQLKEIQRKQASIIKRKGLGNH